MSGGLPDGTPILCRNCGGSTDLLADSSIRCRYCGLHDRLPPDALGRVLEIKRRLAQAEQRAAHVRGFDAAFAGIFEDPKAVVRLTASYVVLGLLILGWSAYALLTNFLPNAGKLAPALVAQVLLGQLIAPLGMFGVAFALGMALWSGGRHYRKHVRPLLIARPLSGSGAFACRACGGSLPPARAADVRCPFCTTLNLVPRELHGAHAGRLLHDAEAARKQLLDAHGAMMSIAARMRRTLLCCGVIAAIVAYVLPMVAMSLLSR